MTQNQTQSQGMTPLEKRAVSGLSLIFALRMLGLFMILPVFSLAANDYDASTPVLIGLAIGAYGLTQALLQIPFGMLSDRIGRKQVITFGLLLFAAGSVVAAMADSIYTVIAGRLLQGSGAIAAAVMALTADLTRDDHRTKAMAGIGISIGLSFSVALAAGAALESWIGLPGIFWATAIMALAGIVVLHLWVPSPLRRVRHRDMAPVPSQFREILSNPQLMRLVASILFLHLLLTASFFALPMALQEAGLLREQQALSYLPVLLLAFVAMVPLIVIAEKYRQMKKIFVLAISLLLIAQLGWALLPNSLALMLFMLWVFFTAFNVLEASLPSMMSKLAPLENKGTALGIYSSAQFVGAFLGGVMAGVVYQQWGLMSVFMGCALLAVVWLAFIVPMPQPRHLSNRIIQLPTVDHHNAGDFISEINAIRGVVETVIVVESRVAYVRFAPDETDLTELEAFS